MSLWFRKRVPVKWFVTQPMHEIATSMYSSRRCHGAWLRRLRKSEYDGTVRNAVKCECHGQNESFALSQTEQRMDEDSPHHNDGVRCHHGPSGSWLKPHVRSSKPARLWFVIFEYAVAPIASPKPRKSE